MNFKEALIAHLQGERVECRLKEDGQRIDFMSEFEDLSVHSVVNHDHDSLYTFRLAPRTIFVNGVEVPAPERVAPENGLDYFFPSFSEGGLCNDYCWQGDLEDVSLLKRGLVYLNKEDAIARAKAMLLTSDK